MLLRSLLSCGILLSALLSVAQLYQEYSVQYPPNRLAGDAHGVTLDMLNDRLIIGSSDERATIYKKNDQNRWQYDFELKSKDFDLDDRFGLHVAIEKWGSWEVYAVTAQAEDLDEGGKNELLNSGAVYIFSGIGFGAQRAKICDPVRRRAELFGTTVALQDSILVVGSEEEAFDENEADSIRRAGAVFVYQAKNKNQGLWDFKQKIVPQTRVKSSGFGRSIAIDGDVMVVGAPIEPYILASGKLVDFVGSAYVFERDSLGVWNQKARLQAPQRSTGEQFGYDVAVSGKTIAVTMTHRTHDTLLYDYKNGLGAVLIYEQSLNGDWNFRQLIQGDSLNGKDWFGRSCDLKDSLLVVGASGNSTDQNGDDTLENAGSSYVFVHNGDSFERVQKIVPVIREKNSAFGNDVAIDQGHIHVGAYTKSEHPTIGYYALQGGATYVYYRCWPSFTQLDTASCLPISSPSNSFQLVQTGTFIDTLITQFGCDSVITINFKRKEIKVNIEQLGDSLAIVNPSPRTYYTWFNCESNKDIGPENSVIISPIEGGLYAARADSANCRDTSTCLNFELASSPKFHLHHWNVYPNPSEGQIHIELFSSLENARILVTDVYGRIVSNQSVSKLQFFDLTIKESGVYTLQLISKERNFSAKVVVASNR